ncbi:MAG: putative Ig domain-containing protein [Terriglobales bacterium]
MTRRKLAFLAVAFCVAGLLSGCGSSSQVPHDPPLVVTTTTLPQGIANSAYSATLSAIGGAAPYAWNVSSGNLPPGLTLARTGIISGTPTATGSFNFYVAVADSEQPPSVANGNLSITITPALQITSPSISYGSPNVYYSNTLAATGGAAPYTWAIVQGSLPNWATFNPTTGVISGTPPGLGTTSFTVQATDSEVPPVTATAGLSIVISPPPPRNAALYVGDGTGLQIQSDGSLTLLPSIPEPFGGIDIGSSPTFPILFEAGGNPPTPVLSSILVNPDYSLTVITSVPIPPIPSYGDNNTDEPPVVDPTGSNLYLPGYIDTSEDTGINIYSANGATQSVGTIAIPDITYQSRLVFTPDGTLGFITTCPTDHNGSIRSYSRSSDGMLTPGPVYALPAGTCDLALTASQDGLYLADAEYLATAPLTQFVQVYSIASDGTLTAVLSQPFTVLLTPQGGSVPVNDMTWDQSGSYLLLATGAPLYSGGVAVLSFSGSALTETIYPTGQVAVYIQRTGSWVYAMGPCWGTFCHLASGISGFDFQSGQLTPLPGSPYVYGLRPVGPMIIY